MAGTFNILLENGGKQAYFLWTGTIPKVLQPYMGGLEVMVPTHKKG